MILFFYDFNYLDNSYLLLELYKEILGLFFFDGNNCFVFVQDEVVQIYFFDLVFVIIIEFIKYDDGDLEDFVVIGMIVYVLKLGK